MGDRGKAERTGGSQRKLKRVVTEIDGLGQTIFVETKGDDVEFASILHSAESGAEVAGLYPVAIMAAEALFGHERLRVDQMQFATVSVTPRGEPTVQGGFFEFVCEEIEMNYSAIVVPGESNEEGSIVWVQELPHDEQDDEEEDFEDNDKR